MVKLESKLITRRNKIGILGGSFDPAHKGHLTISKEAIKRFKLRNVIWAITKKNPFKVPEDYFYLFGKRMRNKITTNSLQDGFITPSNYFNTVENEILRKLITPKRVFISLKNLYRSSAIAAILLIFIYLENTETHESEIGEFFIEEYLINNSSYEIADQFDLSTLNSDLIINSINSISIEDVYLMKIYEVYQSNLIANED